MDATRDRHHMPPSLSTSERSLLGGAPAANEEHFLETMQPERVEADGGWDAYEVWRRFIKEARDRRDHCSR
jgi:hypothetical protein